MRYFSLLLALSFTLCFYGCASTPDTGTFTESTTALSSSPVATSSVPAIESNSDSIISNSTSTISGTEQIDILGAWHFLSEETRVKTPDLYILQFNEDGTAEYNDGWFESEGMETRRGSYTFDGQTVTLSLETTYITEEGQAYGYTPQTYVCTLSVSSSGENLVFTLISGDPLFVYQELDKPLTFMPWPY